MRNRFLLICVVISTLLSAQDIDLSYYLPDGEYDTDITTPKEFLGWEVGEWHVSHDKLYYYMKTLAAESDRITLTEYARSHEQRPLIYLTITSTSNMARIDEIRTEHHKLTNTDVSQDVGISDMPIIIYQGCSIHGNEPSGANGALATVYYLAAAKGDRIDKLLNDVVILFDPVYNPDGLNRFASWVNSHKGKNLIADSNSREFTEAWPRGRTNHYWFDLNRDWLLLTHPESQGRIKTFHQWKPDILTDHHEMGTNSTFFFQPGIASRNNPNTPKKNTELTYEIAKFHGAALDKIGSLYYTQESFDDYYYGKGSTYPDAQGSIGILFEQASSRGHLQESDNRLLTFPFTIRNQVTTMFSTQDAAVALREQILEYKRQSFLDARKLAQKNKVQGYTFGDPYDAVKVNRFIEILLSHQIEVYQLGDEVKIGSTTLDENNGYYVPLDQDQYRLTKSIFEKVSTFQDSLFYDVSAWTMPLAFDIPYKEVQGKITKGKKVKEVPQLSRNVNSPENPYAYLIEWDSYYAPRALKTLQEYGVMVKLANEAFENDKRYNRGTLIIPTGNNQPLSQSKLRSLLEKVSSENQINITGVASGLVESGVNLGSRSLSNLEDPKAMILIGNGVNSYDAGEIWHHFDQRLEMAVPMIDIDQLGRVDLNKYKTIIMPDGSYSKLSKHSDDIKQWVREGGNIVAIKGALQWLKNNQIISLENQSAHKKDKKKTADKHTIPPYERANEERGAKFTGGMIANTNIDITHPLFYGYHRSTLPVFKKGNSFFKPVGGKFNTPARYTQSPHMSGYIHKDNLAKMQGATAVFTSKIARGTIIGLVDNPVFRGYWWGSSKLFANAVFFCQTL